MLLEDTSTVRNLVLRLAGLGFPISRGWVLTAICTSCFLAGVISLTYLATYIQASYVTKSKKDGKRVPMAPHWVPLVGHLLSFFWDSEKLFSSTLKCFGGNVPFRLRLFTQDLYLVAGAQNLNLIWRNSQSLTAKAGHIIGLDTILATPKTSLAFYRADNSGIGANALPGSNVLPEHRVWFLTHQPIMNCLSGPKLKLFTDNFQVNMKSHLDQCQIGQSWIQMPDLYSFIYSEVLQVQLKLLCGSFFLEENPRFTQDFRSFNQAMVYLKTGLPRWMAPKSWKARDLCLASVKKWHAALEGHDPNRLVDTGEVQNERFGNEIMRSRRRIMARMEAMDADTAASADLGLLWALNANSTTATFWFLLETFRNASLQQFVRNEVDACITSRPVEGIPILDSAKLNDSALLQSMYAETLRLRVAVAIIQSAEFADFKFKEWIFPKDRLILISSRIAHMDQESWNTGRNNEHPVGVFWHERFLVSPHDPASGPLQKKREASAADGLHNKEKPLQSSGPKHKDAKYSVAGLTGTWVPYGGGPGICPGRHFAKQIIILASAMILTAFDVELLVEKDWQLEMDLRYNGLGVLPPKTEIPFKIRRRAISKV